jgi:hypothetical protein
MGKGKVEEESFASIDKSLQQDEMSFKLGILA